MEKSMEQYNIVFKEQGEIVGTNGPYMSYGEAHRNLMEMDLIIPMGWWASIEEAAEYLSIKESLIDYEDE